MRTTLITTALLLLLLTETVRGGTKYFAFGTNFDATSLTTLPSGDCYKFACPSTPIGYCFYQNPQDGSVNIDPGSCTNRPTQYCQINSAFSGICANDDLYITPERKYPGQSCNIYDPTSVCAYGPMSCVGGVCQGFAQGQTCSQTADCQPTYYCESGVCTQTLTSGAACLTDNSCGRLAICQWNDSSVTYGYCRGMYTVDTGDQSNKVSINSATATAITKSPMADLLCKSGYSDTSGVCSTGAVSLNAGGVCTSSRDCQTTVSNVYGNCLCGLNANGTKYCDLVAGDQLWVNARIAFKNYFAATTACNIAGRWTPCDNWALYNTWKCAVANAKYYIYTSLGDNTDILNTCVNIYPTELPIFGEISYYCNPVNPAYGMKLLGGLGLVILATFAGFLI